MKPGIKIKSVIWNIRKKKTIKIARRKRIPPKLG